MKKYYKIILIMAMLVPSLSNATQEKLIYPSFLDKPWYISSQYLPQDTSIEKMPYIIVVKKQDGYHISGFDGCNYLIGGLQKVKKRFLSMGVGGTMMACINTTMSDFSVYMKEMLSNGVIEYVPAKLNQSAEKIVILNKDRKIHFLKNNPNSAS